MFSRYWQYLQECLHTGEFGPVRLGMKREEIRELLGEPDDTGGTSRKHRIPQIWKYGEVELHFALSGELSLIYWDDPGGNSIAVNKQSNQIQHSLAIARSEATRDLVVSEASIRYVAFDPNFEDYCYCEYVQEEYGLVKTVRLLRNEERLPGEEIQDERIIEVARSGRLIQAIRLYRAKYQVGLAEGKAGVESLLKRG